MNMGNLNKPTSANWSKVATFCAWAGAAIIGCAHAADYAIVEYIGIGLVGIGAGLPAFISDGK